MDSGVNELEFCTLQSMRSAPVLPDEDTTELSIVEAQSRSRQVSDQDKGSKPSSIVDIVVDEDGIHREVLIAPPKPASNLELDSVSKTHLQILIKQSVENVGLQERSWEDLLAPLPTEILSLIDDQVIRQLARTKTALAKAQVQLEIARAEVRAAQDPKSGKAAKREKRDINADKRTEDHPVKSLDEKSKKQDIAIQLDLRDTARHILLEELAAEHAQGHRENENEKGVQLIDGLPKLTKFLICVSEDVGSTRRVALDPNVYVGAPLFQNDDEDEQDLFDKFIINEEVWQYVGGTIHLKAPEREWNRIEKILTLIVYAACHLKLEMHLLRDSGCQRPPPLPDKSIPENKPSVHREASDSTIQAGPSSEASLDLHPLSPPLQAAELALSPTPSNSGDEVKLPSKSHSRKWSRSNLVSLFFRERSSVEPMNKLKKRLGGRLKMHRTRSLTRKSENTAGVPTYPLSPQDEPLRMPGAFATADDWELVAPEKKVVVNMARTEEEQAGEILTAPASPALSPMREHPPEHLALGNGVLEDPKAGQPNERFKRVIERMQEAALSVSPDVYFPPPSLLQTLREEEQARQSPEITRIPGRPLLGRMHSYAGVTLSHTSPLPSAGLPTSSSVPTLLSSLGSPIPTISLTAGAKISIDARAGLASLMTGNNSLDGTLRHQSIPCLFEKLVADAQAASSLCQPPLWRKIVYYDHEHANNPWALSANSTSTTPISIGDVTLSDFCAVFTNLADSPCSTQCGKTWQDHAFSVIHKDQKITFTLKESLLASPMPQHMLHWIVCSLCGRRSETITLSDASLAFSFGKYVELLLYDAAFHPPKEEFCPHSDDPFSLVRSFLRNGTEIRVKKEAVNLYTLRTPTSVDTTLSQDLNESGHIDNSLQGIKAVLKSEIEDFFRSIKERCGELSNPFSSDGNGARSHIESLLAAIDVADVDRAEEELFKAVEAASIEGINDVRQKLMEACREYTSKFDNLKNREEQHPCKDRHSTELKKPEYTETEHIHVLPANNHVLIRERELSSFIAEPYRTVLKPAQLSKPSSEPLETGTSLSAHDAPSSPGISSADVSPIPTPSDSQMEETKYPNGKEVEWELSAKTKKTVKPTGSILSLKATTPRARIQDIFSLTDGSRSRLSSPVPESRTASKMEDDKVLEALLSATKASVSKPSPLGSSKSPALPSLISSLVNRRHASEATATKPLSEASATASLNAPGISVQRGRAASVRSISTVDSDAVSECSQRSDTSNDTIRGRDDAESNTTNDLSREGTTSHSSVPAKTSTFSTISGFLNRGLRINTLEPSPMSAASESASGPHVKLTFRHEHKKMSCIVYYAQSFAALRQACGLPEALYIRSLERSHALLFSGGKTSAGFWLTDDKRLVLKEMRTSWNVSEVDAMLTYAPNYLNYLMNSERPSLLTKIFGMYTCKIKNLKTGEKQKVDFVVMEHLFFDQQITTKFDLKGISTRVARAKGEGQTLWDADWVESFQTRLLVHAHHKTILREAIAADTEFLQRNNVMDYSALVGVDDKNHTLTIGLIDTLGIFNLAKAIESNSKRVLQAERTIVPPEEYAARFQKALDEYIIASPEKFSKSPGDDEVPALHCPL